MIQIPVARPDLRGNELKYVTECIQTGWISSTGRFVDEFERGFANFTGTEFGVSTSNGTTALHLALVALGIGPGDEVIVPSLTFAASINSILYTGAQPVLVDVEKDSWCLDPAGVSAAITNKTKAVMVVHLYGQVANMDPIIQICRSSNLKIIEDCAEALGAAHHGKKVGAVGDVGCFSFFGNKVLSTGEGGMCTTSDPDLMKRMRKLRDHGMDRSAIYYFHDVVGFNYRMTNLQAAVGLAQLERVAEFISDRNRVSAYYESRLADNPWFEIQKDFPERLRVCWLTSMTLKENAPVGRDDLIAALSKIGIGSRPFFYPMHRMEIYRDAVRYTYSASEYLGAYGFSLPTYVGITNQEMDIVIGSLKSIVGN